jgi:hypothetical protein
VKDPLRYGLAVAGYIVLAMFTKQFLTWTYGPLYFMATLEVLPRTWRRLRALRATPAPASEATAGR